MHPSRLSIVTTTFNCMSVIDGYVQSVAALGSGRFDWVVIDAGSSDGTAEFLARHAHLFTFHESRPDAGVYYGLNRGVAQVKTPWYLVLGADDRLSPSLLDDLAPSLESGAALVLGGVRLSPAGTLKRPGPRWLHALAWGRVISHHSVGTVIRTDLHGAFGPYDTDYRVVADGAFLKRVLQSRERVVTSDAVFGDYAAGGLSDRLAFRSVVETFMFQVRAGSTLFLQLPLLALRLMKMALRGGLRGS
jgi:glycosyltransferase involved in cell wall biosynthesis